MIHCGCVGLTVLSWVLFVSAEEELELYIKSGTEALSHWMSGLKL